MVASDNPVHGFSTQALHAGLAADPVTGARAVPIYQNTSYVFRDAAHAAALFGLNEAGYSYSRLTNPTVAALERNLAALEGGVAGIAASSGLAAQLLALFPLLEPTREIIASNRLYGGTVNQLQHSFKKFGWVVRFVDINNPAAVTAAINANTRAIYAETIANPSANITDLEPLAEIARRQRLPLIIDNTIATPYLCQPLRWGADIIVGSTTKFITGNGTTMGGIVVDGGSFAWQGDARFPSLSTPDASYNDICFAEKFGSAAYGTYVQAMALRDLGMCQAPTHAFQTLLGIETLSLRMAKHCSNAMLVAEYLSQHPHIAWVSYPGLPTHPQHTLAKKYLPKGCSSVFCVGVKGGYAAGKKVVENVRLFSHLANIGDAKSLIIHPASTTHSQLSPAHKQAIGLGDETLRLSIGLEDSADIIADIDTALTIAHA